MGKNGLLYRLQRRLLLGAKAGTLFEPQGELSDVVAGAVKTREAGQNPATRTFQALRIFVNAELEELEQGLSAARRPARPRRPAGRHQLPLARGPHRQDLHRAREPARVRPARAVRRAERRSAARARARQAGRRRGARQPARALGGDAGGRAHRRRRGARHDAPERAAAGRAAREQRSTSCGCRTSRAGCSPSSTRRAAKSACSTPTCERLKTDKHSQATPLRVEKTARDKLAMRTARRR